jgi:hypothetical protein
VCTLLKSRAVEVLAHFDILILAEGARRNLWTASLWSRPPSTIQTAPRHDQCGTGCLYSNAFS